MKWIKPQDGDIRVKKRFLFLPKDFGYEIRWLETVSWVEEFRYSASTIFGRRWIITNIIDLEDTK